MAHADEHDHGHSHDGYEIDVDRTGPCQATIRLTVSKEEIQKTRDAGLKNVAKRTRMKGFRPGKMPRKVLEKHFGEQVDQELVQHFLNHAYDDAVKNHDLKPAAHPRVDPAQVEIDPEQEFRYEFELFLKPDIDLPDYKSLQVQAESFEVTDEEVDETLADLRKRNARPERTEEAGLEEDGMAVCRLSFQVEGEDEPVLDREGIRLSPATPPPGIDADEFREAILGLEEGQERSIPIATYPEDFPNEAAQGKAGQLVVSASEIYKLVPPPDEEVFQAFEVEDEAALKETLTGRIREAKQSQENQRVETELLERLLNETTIELPEPMVEDRADMKVAELRKSLEDEDLDEAALEERLSAERAQAYETQARALRAMYLIEEIAMREELLISRDDLTAELHSIAERNGSTFEEVGKYYQEQGLIQQLGIELLERKVRSFLRESADIQGA